MTIRHLDSLFRPSAVAVVGASRNVALPGGMALRRLRGGGFAGPILAHARRRGLRRIVGVVFNENARMLGLARRFEVVVAHGRDPGTKEIRLDL